MLTTSVTFFDVGHGSCAHIQTPNGKNILLDIGGSDNFSPAKHLKYVCGINQLDALVLTHPHEDHYHDIMNLERCNLKPLVLFRHKGGFPVSKTISNIKDHDKIDCVNNLNLTYTDPVPTDRNPFSSGYNGGVSWKSFFPDTGITKDDPNTFSGLYILEFGGIKLVLTGDNNKEILKEMVKDPDICNTIKDADFLLAPHHGRTTDFCEEFFDIVNPRATIISDKCCEHDSQECSAQAYNNGRGIILENEKRHVLTTRKDGNIVLRTTDTGSYSFSTWQH